MSDISPLLPNDCIHEILLYVPDPLWILAIRLVNRQFNFECCRDTLWRRLLRYVCPLLRNASLWNSFFGCQPRDGDVEDKSESLVESPCRIMRTFFTDLLPRRTLLALQNHQGTGDDWQTILTERRSDMENIREPFVNPPCVPWLSVDPLPITGIDVVGSEGDGLTDDQKREILPFVIDDRRKSRISDADAMIVCVSCGGKFSDPLKRGREQEDTDKSGAEAQENSPSTEVNRALHECCVSWVSSPHVPDDYDHRGFCSRDCFRRQLVGSSDYIRPSHPLLDKEEEILALYGRSKDRIPIIGLDAPMPENSRVLDVLTDAKNSVTNDQFVDGSVVDEKGLGNTLCRDVLADYYGAEQSAWEKLAEFSYATLTNGFRGGDTTFESGVKHRYFHYVAWGGGSFDGFYDETGVEGIGSLLEGPELGMRVGSVKTRCYNRMNHEAKIRWVFFLYRAV